MMENNCEYYLSTKIALQILQTDGPELNNIFRCLEGKKQLFYDRVKYKPGDSMTEQLDDAYANSCEALLTKGRAGTLNIKEDDIVGYFFGIFKHKVFDLIKRNNRGDSLGDVMKSDDKSFESVTDQEKADSIFSEKLNIVLGKMGDTVCRSLLLWRYAMSLSYEEILRRRNQEFTDKNKRTVIVITNRCKDKFKAIWDATN